MNKNQLRKEIRNRIIQLSEQDRAKKSKAACDLLTSSREFINSGVVMVYLSLPLEVDTTGIILKAWQQEKIVAVPKVSWQQRHMLPIQINSLETGLATDSHGLRNPVTGQPVPVDDIDMVIAPGIAFDRQGRRLGRGGAYFDRFFANKNLSAVKTGLAFAEQIAEEVPAEQHDKNVDIIFTDKEIIRVNQT